LRELNKPGIYDGLNEYGDKLRNGLKELFEGFSLPAQIVGEGSMVDFYFTEKKVENYRDAMKSDLELKAELGRQMTSNGIYCGSGRYASSTCHGEHELKLMLNAARSSLKNLKKKGIIE